MMKVYTLAYVLVHVHFVLVTNEGQIACGPLKTISTLCGIYSLIHSDLYYYLLVNSV